MSTNVNEVKITELKAISNAEWTIMRVIWTLKQCTSHQIIHIMRGKNDWKASTVKTLITRLRKKHFIKSERVKNKNLYSPKVSEQKAANVAAMDIFRNICPMHAGRAINHLVQNISISQADVQRLIQTLKRIEPTTPVKVKCNCLDTDAQKEVQKHENE